MLVEGVMPLDVEGLFGVGVPHLGAYFAVAVIQLIVGSIWGDQNVRKLAGQAVGKSVLCVFDFTIQMPGRGQIRRIGRNPLVGGRFSVIVFDDVGRAHSRIFVANEIVDYLLENAGRKEKGTRSGEQDLNGLCYFHDLSLIRLKMRRG